MKDVKQLTKIDDINPIDKHEISDIKWININNINRELRDFLLKKLMIKL